MITQKSIEHSELYSQLFQFLSEKMHYCILFFNTKSIVYKNKRAEKFLKNHELPKNIMSLIERISSSIYRGEVIEEKFPGKMVIISEIGERRWVFRVVAQVIPSPLICVYFTEETISCQLDLNDIRKVYKLTRREVDVLRHLLDGLRNGDIADEMAIAEQTAKEYVSNIFEKVGVSDRFSLLRHFFSAQ